MVLVALFFFPVALPGLSPSQIQWLWVIKCLLPILGPLVFLAFGLVNKSLPVALPGAAMSYMAIPYIAVGLFSTAIPLFQFNYGPLLVFYTLVVVWSGDIFAYYVGKNFGKNKLAPTISPGKTWEGTIASLVGSAAMGSLILGNLPSLFNAFAQLHLVQSASVFGGGPPFRHFPLMTTVLASVVINASAQIGDLVESLIKRGANVKDSGKLLPGHGGVLDRVDALLFAAPVSVLTLLATGLYRLT
jgi:phosphatidate cytidylyltransferase